MKHFLFIYTFRGKRFGKVRPAEDLAAAEKNFSTWCAGKMLSVEETTRPIGPVDHADRILEESLTLNK